MAEAPRSRPIEYYNPRPLILGICFLWGVGVGFCLFYFSPPKQMGGGAEPPKPEPVQASTSSPIDRRNENVPKPAEISNAPAVAAPERPRLETMIIEPPQPILTTEGGLTGRTARPLTVPPLAPTSPVQPPVSPPGSPPRMPTPPPIPELMP